MRILAFLGVVLILVLIVVFISVSIYAFIQRRRARHFENPMFADMTRAERRAYSRELREREQEQYDLKYQQDIIDNIRGELNPERNLP